MLLGWVQLTFFVADLEPFLDAPEAVFFYTIKLSLLLYAELPVKALAGRIARYIRLLGPFLVVGVDVKKWLSYAVCGWSEGNVKSLAKIKRGSRKILARLLPRVGDSQSGRCGERFPCPQVHQTPSTPAETNITPDHRRNDQCGAGIQQQWTAQTDQVLFTIGTEASCA